MLLPSDVRCSETTTETPGRQDRCLLSTYCVPGQGAQPRSGGQGGGWPVCLRLLGELGRAQVGVVTVGQALRGLVPSSGVRPAENENALRPG